MKTSPERPLRVALYSGIVVERDAVSMSFLWKLRLLQRLRDQGHPIHVTGFTQASEFDDSDIRVHHHLGSLVRDPLFSAADVHVFEYAMWYQLFDVLLLVENPSLVIDHNTTPPELVDDPAGREACAKSRLVRHNLHLVTRIATVSEFTRDQLAEMGFDSGRIDVIHLPATTMCPRWDMPSERRGPCVNLLYVGRFVTAKGIGDLLEAMELVWTTDPDVHLTMAGSARFSQVETMDALDEVLSRHEDRLTVLIDASDEVVAELYGRSDVFVMPSHHEGYCIPVVEAMSSGCYVVGSDAGNVPHVMGGLGSVFTTGDSRGLAHAIETVSSRLRAARMHGDELLLPTNNGEMPEREWLDAVDLHLRHYSLSNFEERFLALLEEVVADANGDVELVP
jgi:glycosyltransferase involved in cell wall biosynthesis